MATKKDRYTTALSPAEERAFLAWAKQYGIQTGPGWHEDYDIRGLWKSNPNVKPDDRGHLPDSHKKPNHATFSNESIYATPDAPRWVGTKLVDRTGRVIVDEGAGQLLPLSDLVPPSAYLPGGILTPGRKRW